MKHELLPLLPHLGEATRAALFFGTEGAPPVPLDPSVWRQELLVLTGRRLAGLALAAVEHANVELDIDSLKALHRSQAQRAAKALMVEAHAIEVADAFGSERIPYVVTKGPGIARTYPDVSMRPFEDIDMLVPPSRFTSALEQLSSLGFQPAGPEPRPYFNRICREAVNLKRIDGASIDLHHQIPPWVWGRRLDFADIAAGSETIGLAEGNIRIASPLHNLLIACLHVISDKGRPGQTLLVWRDIVALAGAADASVVARAAKTSRLDRLLRLILQELPTFCQPRELLELLPSAQPSRTDAVRLRLLLPPGIGSRHQIAQALRIPVPNGIAFIAGYLVPSQAFLRNRFGNGRSYVSWWDEAFVRFRDARSTS